MITSIFCKCEEVKQKGTRKLLQHSDRSVIRYNDYPLKLLYLEHQTPISVYVLESAVVIHKALLDRNVSQVDDVVVIRQVVR